MSGFETHLSLTPAFEPGLCNGWLFMIIFPLQWLAVVALPGHFVARTGHPADLRQGRGARIMSWLTQFFCLGKFGKAYRQYMARTPRWSGVPN
jgi:protein-S-isoprenylcysteine O-methyltransferase Ste14